MSDRERRKSASRRRAVIAAVIILAVVAAAATMYLRMQKEPPGVTDLPVSEQPVEPGVPAAPRYPLPAPPAPQPQPEDESTLTPGQPLLKPDEDDAALPELNASDDDIGAVLDSLFSADLLQQVFNRDELVRRFVVTVENLPAKKLPRRELMMVKRAPGQFAVTGAGEEIWMSPDNAARYTPYVRLATSVEPEQLFAVYRRFYPLFQEAYAELGYPNAYFNDRLVDVVDHLLATPTVDEPVRLVRPHVFYQYADPELEALSAGQKALIRMGNANAQLVKERLRQLRGKLTQAASP